MAENFNEVLTMDMGELNGDKFLVMVDWATRYSQAAWVRTKNPEEIMECLMMKWVSYFRVPKKILLNGGREFQNEEIVKFSEK